MTIEMIRTNRKTIAVQITRDGRVLVRAPWFLSDREIRQFVEEKSGWIEKNLDKVRSKSAGETFTSEELRTLAEQALADLPERAKRLAPIVGVQYGKITIRSQVSRWGSCSSKGNLNFNCLLMLTPPEVRDYVVVHELCHRIEMNHSAAFWAEVRRVLPGYEVQKKWLKDHGGELISRLR